MQITRISLDKTKGVLQVHGVDEHEKAVLKKQLPWGKLFSHTLTEFLSTTRYWGTHGRSGKAGISCCLVTAMTV